MKKSFWFILFTIILIEAMTIFAILIELFNKKNKILGIASVYPIKKESIMVNNSDNLKYFYEPKPGLTTVERSWLSQQATYTINSNTLNDRYEYLLEKPEDYYRIITLGDSFTYGVYVNTKDIWPEQLEDILNQKLSCANIKKFEVINLAMAGYDFQYSVERFKKRGVKYKPDLVLWQINDGDFQEIVELIKPFIETLKSKYQSEGKLNYKFDADGTLYDPWKAILNSAVEEMNKEISKEQKLAHHTSQLHLFTSLYQDTLVVFALKDELTDNSNIKLIKDVVNEAPNRYFYNDAAPLWLKNTLPDGHPNEKGHRIIAEDIFNYLINNQITLCY